MLSLSGEKVKKGTTLGPSKSIKRALEESSRSVITPDGWKLSLRDKDLNELYNLKDDPMEMRNLYYTGNATTLSHVAPLKFSGGRNRPATR